MQRFKNILYVAAPDYADDAALVRAATLADLNQANLVVAGVVDEISSGMKLPDDSISPAEFQARRVAECRQKLYALTASLPESGNLEIKVLAGIPFLEIIRKIIRDKHDLLIKSAENGGLLDRVFGSGDMHLLRKCPSPVWLVKPKSPNRYHRILAAVDVDDHFPQEELATRHQLNVKILEMASSLALAELAELHVVHTWEAVDMGVMRHVFVGLPDEKIAAYMEAERGQHKRNLDTLMDETVNRLGSDALKYIKPQVHLLEGYPRKNIPELAGEISADLVVMGTVARTGISGFFMGNTAETILNRLDCSVLALKPSGFKTPVTLND